MRKLGPLVIVVIGLILAWYYFGGSLNAQAPSDGNRLPNIPKPGPGTVNDGADKATDAANKGTDFVAGLSSRTVSWILIGLMAAAILFFWGKSPKFKYMIMGAGLLLVITVMFF